jgi:hypothetical protein
MAKTARWSGWRKPRREPRSTASLSGSGRHQSIGTEEELIRNGPAALIIPVMQRSGEHDLAIFFAGRPDLVRVAFMYESFTLGGFLHAFLWHLIRRFTK